MTIAALGIMQVGVIAHVRAVVTDSAIAGAAYAALADSTLPAGVARTRELVEAGIAADLVTDVAASKAMVSGRSVVAVTVDYRVPAIGPWVPLATSTVTGRALVEIP
ncbi:MAG: pilus assembly protein [Microbacteriaceae bacterium]